MRPVGRTHLALLAAVGAASAPLAAPPRAAAIGLNSVCGAAGFVSGAAQKLCSAAGNGGRILGAGRKLLGGHVGGAVNDLLSGGSSVASKATTALALAAIAAWVTGGARFALDETARVLGRTTSPQLTSTWFSSSYWRVAGISALLTLPFLFAAAIQAIATSDLALLLRSACGHLPLALLCVGIAAPFTMLLLAASDQLCEIVSSTAGDSSGHFLAGAAASVGTVALVDSPFVAFFAGLLTVAAALALWVELLARAAAVYVIVLMLPLVFASLVWPARRSWTIRALELLVALILSKFLIVAILALGGAAISHSITHSVTGVIAGAALVGMAVCAPWALLRLLPMAEVAAGAAAALRGELGAVGGHVVSGFMDDGESTGGREEASSRSGAGPPAADDGAAVSGFPPEVVGPTALRGDPAAEPADGPGAPEEGLDGPDVRGAAPATSAEQVVAHPQSPPAAPLEADVRTATKTGERSPGLHPMWQAEDLSWPILRLGPDEEWPPRIWPPPEQSEPGGPDDDPETTSPPPPAPGQ